MLLSSLLIKKIHFTDSGFSEFGNTAGQPLKRTHRVRFRNLSEGRAEKSCVNGLSLELGAVVS